jgi:hypothetical protein
MDTADHLDRAADLIEANGWRRGSRRGDDTICLVEALGSVHRPAIVACTALVAYLAIPNNQSRHRCAAEKMVVWNDEMAMDQTHVVNVLRECASTLRTKESHDELELVPA